MLAYRLPAAADNDEDPNDFPEFLRPLIELEQCVPQSYYVNMLATFARFRGQGLGRALMTEVERIAQASSCKLVSIQVFESNRAALRLYQRLGFEVIEQRATVASAYHPADQVLLLTKKTSLSRLAAALPG